MPVRSKRLGPWRTLVALATVPHYQCPPGETALVKWVTISNSSPLPTTLTLGVVMSGGAADRVAVRRSIAAGADLQVAVWWVLQAGDVLTALAGAQPVDFATFGAELEGVAD